MKCWMCSSLLVLSLPLHAGPGDFVRGRIVQTAESQIVVRLSVPPDVYAWTSRSDLGDVRVFNAEESEVPYKLRRPGTLQEFSEWRAVPFFALPSNDLGTSDGAGVSVQLDAGGAVVAVNKVAVNKVAVNKVVITSVSGAQMMPAAFLLDLSNLEVALSGLELTWAVGSGDFVGRFGVEASDDLDNWRTVVASATLARLTTSGQTVLVDVIDLPSVKARYLKIQQLDGSEGFALERVQVRNRVAQLPERMWKTLIGRFVKEGYEFATGGRFPVDRIRVRIPGDTFLIVAIVESRAAQDQPWRRRGRHVFYQVQVEGITAVSEPLRVSGGDQFWRVELVTTQASVQPALAVGWLADEIVFVKQGTAPYVLAYGQAGLKGRQWPMRELLERLGANRDFNELPLVTLSAPTTLGGPDKLIPLPEPVDWRTIVLWLVLVGGVAVVGLFAYRLVRS